VDLCAHAFILCAHVCVNETTRTGTRAALLSLQPAYCTRVYPHTHIPTQVASKKPSGGSTVPGESGTLIVTVFRNVIEGPKSITGPANLMNGGAKVIQR